MNLTLQNYVDANYTATDNYYKKCSLIIYDSTNLIWVKRWMQNSNKDFLAFQYHTLDHWRDIENLNTLEICENVGINFLKMTFGIRNDGTQDTAQEHRYGEICLLTSDILTEKIMFYLKNYHPHLIKYVRLM